MGILTIREKWERMLGMTSFDRNENDYKDLYRSRDLADCVEEGECFLIHGNVLPDTRLVRGEFLRSTTCERGGKEGNHHRLFAPEIGKFDRLSGAAGQREVRRFIAHFEVGFRGRSALRQKPCCDQRTQP